MFRSGASSQRGANLGPIMAAASALLERAAAVGVHQARRVRNAVIRRSPSNFAILAYHRVGPTRCDPWDLAVTPEHFDEQVAAVCAAGEVVPLAEELARPGWTRLRPSTQR